MYPRPVPIPNHPEVPPAVSFLRISNTTSFLKEFFQVSVIMKNMADSQFVLTNNYVTLNLPKGLSLASTSKVQLLTQKLDDIAGGEETAASWFVRGDIAGDYDLSADYRGTLMPFIAPVEAKFTTKTPLNVNGNNGLKATLYVSHKAILGTDYRVPFVLSNDSQIPFYMVKMSFGGKSKPTGKTYYFENGSDVQELEYLKDVDSIVVETLSPGESILARYTTKYPGNMSKDETHHWLQTTFRESSSNDGSPEIPIYIEVLPDYDTETDDEDIETGNIYSNTYFVKGFYDFCLDILYENSILGTVTNFLEMLLNFPQYVEIICGIVSDIQSGNMTIADLLKILGNGVKEAFIGDLIYIIEHADEFKFGAELTNEQAYQLGRRTAGAIEELAIIGMSIYMLATAIKNFNPKNADDAVCFTGDTLILTKYGLREIRDIKVGDEVYSQNPHTGEKGLKRVENIFVNSTNSLIHIFTDSEEIQVTPDHPFWIKGGGWIAAGELKANDRIRDFNGNYISINKVSLDKLDEPINVYNFEVKDWHTYFISSQEIFVHNDCIPDGYGKGLIKEGLGKISGKIYTVTQSEINIIKNHLSNMDSSYANTEMIKRLEIALTNGTPITGVDASFYLHELKESSLMSSGMSYNQAHQTALDFYEVSPFSVYHPDVIKMDLSYWNDGWLKFWGITR